MKQKDINKLEMFVATNDYLDTHTEVWNTIPVIGGYKNQLSEYITSIKASALDQDKAKIYLGSNLRNLKKQISQKMDLLDDTLEAYAEDTENEELRLQAANSHTDYFRVPNEEFELKVKNVIALMEEHVEAMTDYGVNQEQIDDAKLSFDNYLEQRGKPRSFQIASRIATQSLSDLFAQCTNVIVKLDRMMKRYSKSNASFYNGYTAARLVIDN